MYLLKSKNGLYYCGVSFDLSLKSKDAQRFATLEDLKSEVYTMRMLGNWPLCEWTYYKVI